MSHWKWGSIRQQLGSVCGRLAAALLLSFFVALVSARPAQAEIASGTWGTCPWELDSNGLLTVHPGTGENIDWYEGEDYSGHWRTPWENFADQIKAVRIVEENGAKVIAPQRSWGLFYQLENLVSADLSGLDTSQVTDLSYMFYGCSALETIDTTGWDTSQVTTMSWMFFRCRSLASLDVTGWDTSHAVSMGDMFNQCGSLKVLDLSSWDTSQVDNMGYMFYSCSSLETVFVSDSWSIDSVTYSYLMFKYCSKLTGGRGTKYSWSEEYPDARFAHVDSADSPGYFTLAGTQPYQKPFFVDADPFDTDNHGAEVEWMGRAGISTGWEVAGGREFRGMQNVTRCDFAAFLYRMADLSDDGARNDSIELSDDEVRDVLAGVSDCTPAKTYHAAEVAWMIDSGISRGWPDKGKGTVSFRPMANVARQDMAAFLYRFADLADDGEQDQSLAMGPETVTFRDVKHGDTANHADEVEWLASVGVTKGWPVGGAYEFRGTRTVARQDMAAFMYRLYEYLD